MKNKYIYRSKIKEKKFREILRYFVLDIEAKKIAELSGVSRNSINKILKSLRELIAKECENNNILSGEVEMDESYFGARRVRGKRGRGAGGKNIVFGLIKRGGKVYTQVVNSCKALELMPIIRRKVNKDATIYTDYFKTYDGLVNYGYKKHYRIKHSNNEFSKGQNHINGIENFWGIAKSRLNKFRGITKSNFYLHLKECEFRFNNRNKNIYKILLVLIRKNPLKLS